VAERTLTERLFFSGWSVVFVWAVFNAILASILAGFTASGFVGGAGTAGALTFAIYAVSTTAIFVFALIVFLGRRRRRGLSVPPRPSAVLLLAVAMAFAWLGLAVEPWLTFVSAAPAVGALVAELYPR